MRFEKIKADTPVPLTHVNPEGRKGTYKYNTMSKVKHVTTFKNTPQIFKKDMTDTSTTHIGSNYIAKTDPQKDTITMEPVAQQNTCETTGKILGYRDLVKRDPPVWKNSMCNELGRMYQGWKANAGTDTIEFIFKRKPKDIREKYVRLVCAIRPQHKKTHRTRLTAEGI